MIGTFKKIWHFAKDEHSNIIKSVIISFFNAVFYMLEMGALFFAISGVVSGSATTKTIWICLGFMLVSIIGRIFTRYLSQLQQTHAGYFMAADKRISIGQKIKRIPMGFFNESSLGNLTGICTTVLSDVEMTSAMVLVTTLSGFITTAVFVIYILFFDWRIGLIALSGVILFLLVTSAMEKKTCSAAPKRQRAQANLVENMLETVQGMAVVKSFNLTRIDDKKIDRAIENIQKTNLGMEKVIIPYTILQELVLRLASIGIMTATVLFCIKGTMEIPYGLMFIIVSFILFQHIEAVGHAASIMRVCSSSIDEACSMDNTEEMDVDGKTFSPKIHDIEFRNVSFSYENRPILDHVSITLPDKTTTAIVGPSGSGKTTVCNLVARFWDVDNGSISVGGYDVREYKLSSLMKQISIVFQDVYLFNDTIENNIRFGRPHATRDEVIAAAKKACCHNFITKFPNGYDTVIFDDGAALSGGEKQRISIARAILKDAPIIILDEATANVDPENEKALVNAIEELTQDKTIVMIAHRLKTVRNADKILVLNEGRIVQQGKHEELIHQNGIYADFVHGRKRADDWKLGVEH